MIAINISLISLIIQGMISGNIHAITAIIIVACIGFINYAIYIFTNRINTLTNEIKSLKQNIITNKTSNDDHTSTHCQDIAILKTSYSELINKYDSLNRVIDSLGVLTSEVLIKYTGLDTIVRTQNKQNKTEPTQPPAPSATAFAQSIFGTPVQVPKQTSASASSASAPSSTLDNECGSCPSCVMNKKTKSYYRQDEMGDFFSHPMYGFNASALFGPKPVASSGSAAAKPSPAASSAAAAKQSPTASSATAKPIPATKPAKTTLPAATEESKAPTMTTKNPISEIKSESYEKISSPEIEDGMIDDLDD